MTNLTQILPRLVVMGGVALAINGCARPQQPTDTAALPQTGSAQGLNPHNSEPMPSGMVMRNNGLPPSTALTTDPSSVPQTGSEQGANPHTSQPMRSGMVMPSSRTSPMRFDPNSVPQTGSAQGVNPHNSQPMPSGMVMPDAPARY